MDSVLSSHSNKHGSVDGTQSSRRSSMNTRDSDTSESIRRAATDGLQSAHGSRSARRESIDGPDSARRGSVGGPDSARRGSVESLRQSSRPGSVDVAEMEVGRPLIEHRRLVICVEHHTLASMASSSPLATGCIGSRAQSQTLHLD